jgi:cell division septum initiation protein DivIVA
VANTDSEVILRKIEQTLDAASQVVSLNKERAERIRDNWRASRKATTEDTLSV